MTEQIKGKFEGYIWQSDKVAPEVFYPATEKEITLDDSVNPFIIEGELYDASSGLSVSIRFVDGHYIIKKTTVKPSDIKDSDNTTVKEYLAQRMPGILKLRYLQLWNSVKDPLCEDMETLQPGDLVFVGFITKED